MSRLRLFLPPAALLDDLFEQPIMVACSLLAIALFFLDRSGDDTYHISRVAFRAGNVVGIDSGCGWHCYGFSGPLALNREANQGPLLRILITGPPDRFSVCF